MAISDDNNDGVSNGLAWLLGAADPDVNAFAKLPTVTESESGLVLEFSFLNAANRGSAVLSVEHSNDLGNLDAWTAIAVPEVSGGPVSGVTFVITANGNFNDVVATISFSEAPGGRIFGRLNSQE